MVSGPGAEEGEHFVREEEISSAVRGCSLQRGGGWRGGAEEVVEEKNG